MIIKLPCDFREINITCKGLYNSNSANKDDLGSFLNELAIVYSEAAKYNIEHGHFEVSADCDRKAMRFHRICAELGMYDNL